MPEILTIKEKDYETGDVILSIIDLKIIGRVLETTQLHYRAICQDVFGDQYLCNWMPVKSDISDNSL